MDTPLGDKLHEPLPSDYLADPDEEGSGSDNDTLTSTPVSTPRPKATRKRIHSSSASRMDEDNSPSTTIVSKKAKAQVEDDQNSLSDRQLLISLSKQVQSLNTQLNEKLDNISYGWETSIKQLTEEVQQQNATIGIQKQLLEEQGHTITKLETLVENLYCTVNENNLVLKGLNCRNSGEARQEIVAMFKGYGSFTPPNISEVRNLGHKKFMVKFLHNKDKKYLFAHARDLRKHHGIELEDDLPPKLLQDKSMLLQSRRELLDNGVAQHVKVLKRGLLLDGKDYFNYDRKTHLIEKAITNRPMQNKGSIKPAEQMDTSTGTRTASSPTNRK